MKYPLRIFEVMYGNDADAVGQVVEFENGCVAVGYYKETGNVSSIVMYKSLKDVKKLHEHNGATKIRPVKLKVDWQ